MPKKILVTGGHLTPALAVILRLLAEKKYQIYYLGRKFPLEGDKSYSLEYRVIKKLKIPFYSLIGSRLQRVFTFYTFFSLLKLPFSFLQSVFLLLRIKPALILSFGSYVSLPVCFWAYFFRIPVVIHEQTSILGLSNRIIARWAKVICLSWENTLHVPRNKKIIITGNPTLFEFENEIVGIKNQSFLEFGNNKLPLIYVTGGSLGSRFINRIIGDLLEKILEKFRVLHQTGEANNSCDYNFLIQKRKKLPKEKRKNYKLVKSVHPFTVPSVFRNASFLIGRAGANTTYELQVSGLPSILIPLPWSASREQEKNAARLFHLGMSVMLSQENLTSENLWQAIENFWLNFSSYKKNAQLAKSQISLDASFRIAKIVHQILFLD